VETADRKRGYDAEVLGFVETREGKVTRFDMVVKGQFWGDTAETRGAPNGRHPLAITFSLVTGLEETDKIPPAMIFEEGYKREPLELSDAASRLSFLLRASVRRHRSAQGDRSTLRSITPMRAMPRATQLSVFGRPPVGQRQNAGRPRRGGAVGGN